MARMCIGDSLTATYRAIPLRGNPISSAFQVFHLLFGFLSNTIYGGALQRPPLSSAGRTILVVMLCW